MLVTRKPTKNAVKVEEKEIEFFNDTDITKFKIEALRTYNNNKPVYKYGSGLVGILYTGMRISEALALRWNDIDFEHNDINVQETQARVIDRDKIK